MLYRFIKGTYSESRNQFGLESFMVLDNMAFIYLFYVTLRPSSPVEDGFLQLDRGICFRKRFQFGSEKVLRIRQSTNKPTVCTVETVFIEWVHS